MPSNDTPKVRGDGDALILVPYATIETIGKTNDNFCTAYNRYLNRKTEAEGKEQLKDLRLIGKDLIRAIDKLEEEFLSKQLHIPTPPRDLLLLSRIGTSIDNAQGKFTMRYLNYTQLAAQFTAPVAEMTQEVLYHKIQKLYEMRELVRDVIEQCEVVDPSLKTALLQ